MQVGDAQLGEVVEPTAHSGNVSGEAVDVADVSDRRGRLEPGGVHLAATVERAQRSAAGAGGVQHAVDKPLHKGGGVQLVPVHLLQGLDELEVVQLEAGREGLPLDGAERCDCAPACVGEQRHQEQIVGGRFRAWTSLRTRGWWRSRVR